MLGIRSGFLLGPILRPIFRCELSVLGRIISNKQKKHPDQATPFSTPFELKPLRESTGMCEEKFSELKILPRLCGHSLHTASPSAKKQQQLQLRDVRIKLNQPRNSTKSMGKNITELTYRDPLGLSRSWKTSLSAKKTKRRADFELHFFCLLKNGRQGWNLWWQLQTRLLWWFHLGSQAMLD